MMQIKQSMVKKITYKTLPLNILLKNKLKKSGMQLYSVCYKIKSVIVV